MSKEQTNLENPEYSQENMFAGDAFEVAQKEEEDDYQNDFPISSFAEAEDNQEEEEVEEDQESEESNDSENDDEDEFNFEDSENAEENEKEELDLEKFNKMFDKNFKTNEELKFFMSEKSEEEASTKEHEEYNKAVNNVETFSTLIEIDDKGFYKIDDESLMRKEFESIALQEGKDLTDEDVRIDIEEQIESLKDAHVLDIKADHLRSQLKDIYNQNKEIKDSFEQKKADLEAANQQKDREQIQSALVDLHKSGQFYGVETDKEKITEVYKKIASGKFIEDLQNNKKELAELALISAYKDIIFKKATGLTYNEGLKAVLDEFKAKGGESKIVKAQKRGSTASNNSGDLLSGLLSKGSPKADKE